MRHQLTQQCNTKLTWHMITDFSKNVRHKSAFRISPKKASFLEKECFVGRETRPNFAFQGLIEIRFVRILGTTLRYDVFFKLLNALQIQLG